MDDEKVQAQYTVIQELRVDYRKEDPSDSLGDYLSGEGGNMDWRCSALVPDVSRGPVFEKQF